jgi:hypothetical protein
LGSISSEMPFGTCSIPNYDPVKHFIPQQRR